MSDNREKSDGGRPPGSDPEEAKGRDRQQEKKGVEGQVPDFDKVATDLDTMMHDGP